MQSHDPTHEPRPAELYRLEGVLRSLDPLGAEMSIVELVLFACDATDDQTEVRDLVDGLVSNGAARLLPRDADPMLTPVDCTQAAATRAA